MLVVTAYMSILLIPVTGDIKLQAHDHQTLNCNKKTVLQCNISSPMPFKPVDINWIKTEKIECNSLSNNSSTRYECNHTTDALRLIILHPKPKDTGTYFCNIRTNVGHSSKNFNVSIGDCEGEFSYSMTGQSQVECAFNGIYPQGIIRWFHYNKSVTSQSTLNRSLENPDGTFNITSAINLPDKQTKYNCSLWSLKNGKYLLSQQIEVPPGVDGQNWELRGSSRQHYLQWTLLFLGLMFS